MDALSTHSIWSGERVETFLSSYRVPLRLAVQTEAGFPMICSLWFLYEAGRILCATQSDSAVARHLEANARCAFELAPNEPPYFGVRGRGLATIATHGADVLLDRLIERYLSQTDSKLAGWLRSRADQEVCLVIEPTWLTSWDYSDRMSSDRMSSDRMSSD